MLSSFQNHFGLETSKHRSPRLELSGCYQDDDDCSHFRLLFCDCNHRQDSENGYEWKWRCVEIRITPDLISRFLELEPRVIYKNGYESFFRLPNQEDKKLSRQFVLRELQTQLADVERNEILYTPHIGTTTLRHFLALGLENSNDNLGDVKQKLGLSWALAKATGQFYKTSMMPRLWTEDTIEFMFHKHGEWATSFLCQIPMISAPVDPDPPEDDISVLTSHFAAQSIEGPKFPEIKVLGVMLLQIRLLMPMAQLSMKYPEFFENGTVTRMGQLNLCHSLDTGILRHLPEARLGEYSLGPLCIIIQRCFQDELFEQRTDEEVHIRIHDRLVRPLALLKKIWEAREAEESHEEGEG